MNAAIDASVFYNAFHSAFEKAVQKAGWADFICHDLRHTFASRLMMVGDLPTVKHCSDTRTSV